MSTIDQEIITGYTYQLMRGSENDLLATNPFLAEGEPVVVFRSNGAISLKVGDGVNNYKDLPFVSFDAEALEDEVTKAALTAVNEKMLTVLGNYVTSEKYERDLQLYVKTSDLEKAYSTTNSMKAFVLETLENYVTANALETTLKDYAKTSSLSGYTATTAFEALKEKVAQLEGLMSSLDDSDAINEVVEDVTRLTIIVETLETSVETVEQEITNINNKIDGLTSEVNAVISTTKAELLDEISTESEELNNRIDSVVRTSSDTYATITTVGELSSKLTAAETRIKNLEDSTVVNTLLGEVAVLKSDVERLESESTELNNTISAVSTRVGEIYAELNHKISDEVGTINNRIDGLENATNASFDKLEKDVDEKIARAIEGATAGNNANNEAILEEKTAREDADNAEKIAREDADNAEKTARMEADEAEKNARIDADSELDNKIDEAVALLQGSINSNATTLTTLVSSTNDKVDTLEEKVDNHIASAEIAMAQADTIIAQNAQADDVALHNSITAMDDSTIKNILIKTSFISGEVTE